MDKYEAPPVSKGGAVLPIPRPLQQEGVCCHASAAISLLATIKPLAEACVAKKGWIAQVNRPSADDITTGIISGLIVKVAETSTKPEDEAVPGAGLLAQHLFGGNGSRQQQDASETLLKCLESIGASTEFRKRVLDIRAVVGVNTSGLKVDTAGLTVEPLVGSLRHEFISWTTANVVALDVGQVLQPVARLTDRGAFHIERREARPWTIIALSRFIQEAATVRKLDHAITVGKTATCNSGQHLAALRCTVHHKARHLRKEKGTPSKTSAGGGAESASSTDGAAESGTAATSSSSQQSAHSGHYWVTFPQQGSAKQIQNDDSKQRETFPSSETNYLCLYEIVGLDEAKSIGTTKPDARKQKEGAEDRKKEVAARAALAAELLGVHTLDLSESDDESASGKGADGQAKRAKSAGGR